MPVVRLRSWARLALPVAIAGAAAFSTTPGAPVHGKAATAQIRGFATNIFGAQTLGTVAFAAWSQEPGTVNDFELFSALELDTPEAIVNITPELAEMKAAGAPAVRLTFPSTTLET